MMANCSSLVQNIIVKKDENVEKFPYRIFNDLTKKLKDAEAAIANMLAEREALEYVKNDEINNLKQRILELTYENNRYHLAISNCTFCAPDDSESSEVPSVSDASITASTSVSSALPSSDLDQAFSSRAIPALMSLTITTTERRQVKANTVVKDKTFITGMMKTLTKLELKYQTPEHKRKKRLFTRRQKTSCIVPKEFTSIYHALAAPEPEVVSVPEPFPHVKWNDIRFKPALPDPEPCPVQSCSPDPVFYVDRDSPSFCCNFNFAYVASQNGRPFGSLPGYKTSLGVVTIPTMPIGGYVYCPDAKRWVLYAEPQSSPSAGRGTRRGGTPPARRRRG